MEEGGPTQRMKDSHNRVETEREIPKLKFITHGVLTDCDMLLYLARISIW